MLKPSSNYRMSSLLKISLATGKFKDAHQRGAWKRACIDAELCSKIVPKSTRGDRDNKRPQGTAYNTTSTSATPSAE